MSTFLRILHVCILSLVFPVLSIGAEPDFVALQMPAFVPDRDRGIEATLERLREGSNGKTVTVKNFDPAWVRSLFERGEPTVYTRENSADFAYIGMPIGGLTAGQVYLGGDGPLWHWDIFNTRRPTRGVNAYRDPRSQYSPLEQGFAVQIRTGEKTRIRTLDRRGFTDVAFRGQYPIGYVHYEDEACPVSVDLEAYSPFIPLNLDASSYPATVLEYTVKNTGRGPVDVRLAGWLENFTVKEKASELSGKRRNAVTREDGLVLLESSAVTARPTVPPRLRPEIVFENFESGNYDNWKIEGSAFGKPGEALSRHFHHQPLRGFEGKHLADSFRNDGTSSALATTSDDHVGKLVSKPFAIARRSIRFLVGGGSHADTCIRLLVDGKVVRKASGNQSETLVPKWWDVGALEGNEAVLEIVDGNRGGWGHILVDRIVFTDEPPVPVTSLEEQRDFGTMGLAVVGHGDKFFALPEVDIESLPGSAFVDAEGKPGSVTKALADRLAGVVGREFPLEPGASAKTIFLVAWFFPKSRLERLRTDTTRWYASRFGSARDVAVALRKNLDSLASQTRLWKDTWYDSTLPYWFLDRTFLNTSILATETCYRFRDDRFYADEGVHCCPGTCTHVWGYVQATGRLFPALEKSLREMVDFKEGIAFYPGSGAISFRGEIYRGPNTAVDGQSGVILRTYREHQMSADDSFLRRNYAAAKKAMDFLTTRHDADLDGILEGGQHNTLDANWYGKITWLSLYYCAALRAMERMALEMEEMSYAKRVRMIADRGAKNIADELFNGEYFIQKPDPKHPESPGSFTGCEYSQLLGQGWAYQVGLGRITDNDKVRTALRWLWRYNFTTDVGPFREKNPNGRWYAMPGEGGLLACTFPQGGSEVLKHGNRHFAGYLNECQNGYEYGATSLMMWEGMVEHALAHARILHDRYHASRRNPWNEIECGEHYARSMASYGLFTAICGFEYHGPKGYLAFSPRLQPENFRAAFTSAQGWGTFSQARSESLQTETLDLRWGVLRLRLMAFDLPLGAEAESVSLKVAGEKVSAQHTMREHRVILTLDNPLLLRAGQSLVVQIRH